MRTVIAVAVTLALLTVSCSGDGITAEEHAQALSELALAQQQIIDLRIASGDRVASEAATRLSQWQAAVDEAVSQVGLVPDPGRDAIYQVTELFVDLHADRARYEADLTAAVEELDAEIRRFQEEQERLIEEYPTPTTLAPGEGGPGIVDSTTVSSHLVLISLLAAIGSPDVDQLIGLRDIADATGNQTAIDGLQEMIDLAPAQSPGEFREMRDVLIQTMADTVAFMLETGTQP